MPIPKETLHQRIADAFPEAEITINDLAGDNDHWSVTITCASFNGKPRITQHRMVHDALKGSLGGELHALQIKTIAKT